MKSAAQVNGKKKKPAGAEDVIYQGICSSCENFPLCNYIHGARTPVEFCEEFANPQMLKTRVRPELITRDKSGSEQYKGLCATCENSGKCLYPKDDAGIWHCEEYR
jgi:hypothetical protein